MFRCLIKEVRKLLSVIHGILQNSMMFLLAYAVGCLDAGPIWQENIDTMRIANRLTMVR